MLEEALKKVNLLAGNFLERASELSPLHEVGKGNLIFRAYLIVGWEGRMELPLSKEDLLV